MQAYIDVLDFGLFGEVTGGRCVDGAHWTRVDNTGYIDERPDCECCEATEPPVWWVCLDGGEVLCEDCVSWTPHAEEQYTRRQYKQDASAQASFEFGLCAA